MKKLIKSKKYKGVFYFIKEGKKFYSYRYHYKHTVDGIEKKLEKNKIVGSESDGITEKIAFLEKVKSQGVLKNKTKIKKETLPTLNELSEKYFSVTDAKSKKKMQQRYNKYIKDASFAKIPINPNMRLSIFEWRNNLLEKLSKKTINDYITLIAVILNFGKDNNLDKGLFDNHTMPTYKCKFKKANVKRQGWLSQEEIVLLLNTVKLDKDKHLYLFVMIALYTGARFQSILNIQKKDINFDSSFINIKNGKTEKVYTCFFNEKLAPLLHHRVLLLNNPNDYLFQDEGIRINTETFQKRLLKILDKLFNQGLDKKDTANRIVIHSLRHTCASHMAMNGASGAEIKGQLDHASIAQSDAYIKISHKNAKESPMRLDFGD